MKNSDLFRVIEKVFYKVEQAPCRETATYCLDVATTLFEEFSDNLEFEERYEILLIWKRAVLKINKL